MATISSKGQITIPVEARRKLGLDKKVQINLEGDRLVLEAPKTMADIWAMLDEPSDGAGMSDAELQKPWVQAAVEKDRRNRGY